MKPEDEVEDESEMKTEERTFPTVETTMEQVGKTMNLSTQVGSPGTSGSLGSDYLPTGAGSGF